MINTLLKKLKQRTDISAEEERVLRGLIAETRNVRADATVVRAGTELDVSLLLIKGWLARTKDLPGGERQMIELHVAGDFADLHGFTLKCLDHDVIALTDCTLAIAPHKRLRDITESFPRLARVLWMSTNIDAAIHREQIVSLGQRSAISRMAHLFCELYMRLEIVGHASGDRFEFPLTQRETSEYLGLTVVHVNRTLQELRRRELVEVEQREVRILDRDGLEAVAEFDPLYLNLHKRQL